MALSIFAHCKVASSLKKHKHRDKSGRSPVSAANFSAAADLQALTDTRHAPEAVDIWLS